METGILQQNWLDGAGCIYNLPTPSQKLDPASAYLSIPSGCRAGFGIGILVALNAVVAMYALWNFAVRWGGGEEVSMQGYYCMVGVVHLI